MSYITAIGTAVPMHRIDQTTIGAFMERMMALDEHGRRQLRALFRASGIQQRYSVLGDYAKAAEFEFYPNQENAPFPSTEERMRLFRQHALTLSVNAVDNLRSKLEAFDPNAITHLVVVCCTGMYAPGLDIELVKSLALRTTVERTSITFMGCYAAFNALKAANAFCSTRADAKVLIVCTELCSIHFQHTMSEDNLLANTLFADGSAAILVEAEASSQTRFSIEAFHSDLAIEGENDMAWHIGDLGFEMKLTAYIPKIIKEGIQSLTEALLQKVEKPLNEIRHFAFHPGGLKILEALELALGIDKSRNRYAYHVLKNYGNMSSPTVVFVLKEIMDNLTIVDNDQHILSLAFGPGLTLESMILKIETR